VFETEIDPPPNRSRKYTPRDYAVWLAGMLAVSVISVFVCGYVSWRDARIALREQTAIGVIASSGTYSRYGPWVNYVFSFESRRYDGGDSGKYLSVGEKAVIYFDPDDPSRNGLTDYRFLGIWSHSFMIGLIYVSIGLAIILMIRLKTLPPNEARDSENQSDESF
jgi:hypothetical protein